MRPEPPSPPPGSTRPGPTRPGSTDPRSASLRSPLLWFGILGGMFAWIAHLGVSYALIPWICATGNEAAFHLLTLLLALTAAAATLVSGWIWRSASPPTLEDPGQLRRFLGLFGLFLSGFFLLLILVEGLPALLDPAPCEGLPTLDQPIVLEEGAPVTAGLPLPNLWLPKHPLPNLPLPPLEGPRPLLASDGLVAPGQAWTAWNPDPWILGLLGLLTLTYLTGVRRLWRTAGRGRGLPRRRADAYLAGVAVLVLALVSPIDAIGETLFSAHMVQHMLLMVVAAPLLVLGRPEIALLWALPQPHRKRIATLPRRSRPLRIGWKALSHPLSVLALHVGTLWLWHVPTLYQAALANSLLHGLEHAMYLGTAMLFWWALLRAGRMGRWPGYGAGILYVFGAALQSGALGALLLFARAPWYPAHAPGAELWGIDLLVDQQLAGTLMWVPAGLVYTAAILLLFVAWLRRADRTVARREGRGWELDPPPHADRVRGT